MNLILDVGNTVVKLAVYDHNNQIHLTQVSKTRLVSSLKKLIKQYHINKSIVSNVSNLSESAIKSISNNTTLLIVDHHTKVPFINLYKTPETLGPDRIALAAAAAFQYPYNNVLVIDVGTCITYDFVNDKKEYLGGAISPGLQMRYKAMHNFTAKLPLLNPNKPAHFIGNTTNSAMHGGVFVGILHEIDGFISAYKNIYPNLTIILTGGDSKILGNQLKNTIFANSNFLLEGLNGILEFNNTK